MKPYFILMTAVLSCAAVNLKAQEKSPVKFGKISPEDFTIKQAYDTGASAVVIADMGSSVFEGNMKGSFSIVYKRVRRIKILNKNGFDAAKVEIPLYVVGHAEEKLDDLKAYTYNLENGKVIETKLDNASLFKDQLSPKLVVKKFTFPAVKEGSVIEYSYIIKSDFLFNLQPWAFQDEEYPCLWSEYEVGIPEFFNYVTISQGSILPVLNTSSNRASFRVMLPNGAEKNDMVTLSENVNTRHWIMKNIPALKEETYTSAIKNYIANIEFQLASFQLQGEMAQDFMGNWKLLAEKLMAGDNFGADLAKNNNWLDADLKNVTTGTLEKLEKAKKIFAWVRDNMTCTATAALYLETSLKDAYKKHSGNVADINLLLTAMLRHEGIEADPLILSTKSHGFSNEIYPLVERFNYVVCEASIDGVFYNLDASSPYNGFNRLPVYCYNGHARLIKKDLSLPVYFESDSLKEQKMTSVFINNDDKEGLIGSYKSQLGYYESFNLRKKLNGDLNAYLKNIKSGNSFDMNVTEAGIDSLKKPDMPAVVHYDFSFKPPADENIIYLNPMLSEGYKENPFTAAERKYPVEMSYTVDETYLLNMEIPKGYVVEEIPKSAKVAFNEDEGFFEYMVQKSDDGIQLRSRIKLNKATFTPEDYAGLREFFGFIVKKQNEQIVLKKK